METKDIIHQLGTAEDLPKAALLAGANQVDQLRENIYELAGKFTKGIFLLPHENQFLFYGLHILVAKGDEDLFDLLEHMVHSPEFDLEELLGDEVVIILARFFITCFDDKNESVLFKLLEDQQTSAPARQALFMALARLTFDGRIDLVRTKGFVTRFEREALANEDEGTWFGWMEIVVLLGLTDLEPALKNLWEKQYFEHFHEVDRTQTHKRLHEAASHPKDEQRFIDDQLTPMTDLIGALSWIERIIAYRKELEAKNKRSGGKTEQKPQTGLPTDEYRWLANLLVSRQAPATCMDMEMLDGFFTALITGPTTVPPSEFMPLIWDPENQQNEIEYDSKEQAEYTVSLLMRHWDGIAAELLDNGSRAPTIQHQDDSIRGQGWAVGFINAMTMSADDWKPLMNDPQYGILTASIMALVSDKLNTFDEPVTPAFRADLLDALPKTIHGIRAYWLGEALSPPKLKPRTPPSRNQPVHSNKTGRNHPCPCGSGKKYKHCCGAA